MGFFDSLFGKKEVVSPFLYTLECSLHPFRLAAFKNDTVDLEVCVRNNSDRPLLTSIVTVCSKAIGFDTIGLQQQHESRLGELKPGETRFLKIPVHSTPKSQPGNYKIAVFAISHYRDYAHILNEVKRTLEVRVA
ncbi:MAG: hypothetical protein QXR53_04245 [Candidatus Norongarragalinales archaeon]